MQVTDPVCGMTLDSGKAAAKEVWQGETYYLCSASCHDQFKATPERYAKKAAGSAQTSGRPAH
jgi:YHS domain-containing protein